MRVCTRMRAHECTFHRFGSQSCLWKLVILQVFSLLFFFFFLKSLLGLKPVSYTSLLYQSVDHCFLYRTQAENPRQFPSVSSLNTHENQEGQAKKRNPGKKKRKKKGQDFTTFHDSPPEKANGSAFTEILLMAQERFCVGRDWQLEGYLRQEA